MARFVHEAIRSGGSAIVEAGTGSGKSFGYLIPLLDSEGPHVVSTGTIALQEQLLQKDLPFLQKAYKKFSFALAKGRSNYLCRQKFWEVDRSLSPRDPFQEEFARLRAEMPRWSGDLADLSFVPSPSLWFELASDGDDCLGSRCEFLDSCAVRISRRRIANADLVVANHALYFSDLASGGAILPDHHTVVFDEAHKIAQAAIQAFSVSVGRYALTRLIQKIRRRLGRVPDEISFELIGLDSRLLNWVLKSERSQYRLYPDADFLDVAGGMLERLNDLKHWLEEEALDPLLSLSPKAEAHRDRLLLQTEKLSNCWDSFSDGDSALLDRVYWVEQERERSLFDLRCAPLDVGNLLRKSLWSKRQAILTSATLSAGGDFGYFSAQIGLEGVPAISLPSPFDFSRQAVLYVPRFLPEPNAPEFANHSRDAILDILLKTEGRAFVLFTSYRALHGAFSTLSSKIPFPLKRQGDLPRAQLIEWFKNTPHAVLFATSSFWEGVDIPGEALSCVIIDRIPFSVPDDPVIEAQVERLKLQGRDWFNEFTLPQAIIRLKQGFGRLIRTQSDRGVVAILDNRLFTKYYGRAILKSLPDCPQVRDFEKF